MTTYNNVDLSLIHSEAVIIERDRHDEGLKQLGFLTQMLTVGRDELELNADALMGLTLTMEDITARLTLSQGGQG